MPQHVTKLIIMLDIDILQVDLLTKVSTSADMGNATMGNRFIPSWYLHVLSTTHESHYYWLNNHINTVTGILVIKITYDEIMYCELDKEIKVS